MAEKRKKIDVASLSRDTVKEIAERYALDYEHYTIADLCKIYNLSQHYFRKVIKRAICECIVTYQLSEAIRDKSIANQHRHFEKGKASASQYYMILFNERFQYFKENVFEPAKAPVIAKNYLHTNLNSISISLGLSARETFYYIWKGSCYFFTKTEYTQFIEKLKKDFPKDTSLTAKIQKLDSFRKIYTEVATKLEIANQQLACLDEVLSSEDEAIGRKEMLEDEIDELTKLINTLRSKSE